MSPQLRQGDRPAGLRNWGDPEPSEKPTSWAQPQPPGLRSWAEPPAPAPCTPRRRNCARPLSLSQLLETGLLALPPGVMPIAKGPRTLGSLVRGTLVCPTPDPCEPTPSHGLTRPRGSYSTEAKAVGRDSGPGGALCTGRRSPTCPPRSKLAHWGQVGGGWGSCSKSHLTARHLGDEETRKPARELGWFH